MKRILSIDWDYFVSASATQRYMLFPDGGNENISAELQSFIWNTRYAQSPVLRDMGILKNEYKLTHDILRKFCLKYCGTPMANPHREALVTISHRWIYDFILERTNMDEEFEVYNIDFHHDMYCYKTKGQEVNCGNWVNCLIEHRPEMQYHWIKRDDSDVNIIDGDKAPFIENTFEDIAEIDFDYVFICRSDCWSPPHLDTFFDTLWAFVMKYMPVEVENNLRPYRKVAPLSELENHYSAEIALAKSMRKYPNATCIHCGAILPEGSDSWECPSCIAKGSPLPKLT